MFDVNVSRGQPNHEDIKIQQNESHTYSACKMRWSNVTALDHAIFARMAYFQAERDRSDLQDMQDALAFAFPKPQYNVELVVDWETHPQRINDTKRGLFTKYYRFDFHNLKHSVIAVQGTDISDYRDILADARLWVISAVIDIAEWFIPPLNLLLPRQRAALQFGIDKLQAFFTLDEEEVRISPTQQIDPDWWLER